MALVVLALALSAPFGAKAATFLDNTVFGDISQSLADDLHIDDVDKLEFDGFLPGLTGEVLVSGTVYYWKDGTRYAAPFGLRVIFTGDIINHRVDETKAVVSQPKEGGTTDASSNPHLVGYANITDSTPFHAFRFDFETSQLDDLGTLDAGDTAAISFARAITGDASVVVGFSDIPGSTNQHGFRWAQADGMKDLDPGETAVYSRAFEVDDAGDTIVGERADEAVRWDWNDVSGTATFTELTSSGGIATAISLDGKVIVGQTTNDGVAFRWWQATGREALAPLPGHLRSAALGVSENGKIIVGVSQDDPIVFTGVGGRVDFNASEARAFRWSDLTQGGAGMEDLNDLLADAGADLTDITLVAVTGMSPDGQWLIGAATTPETVGLETVPFIAQYCDEYLGVECEAAPSDNDLLADFGAPGLWEFLNNTTWKKLHAASPMHIGSGDLDGTGQDEAITGFGGVGLWARFDDTTWVKLHNATAQRFATGDLDGNGRGDLIVDFGGGGLWVRYNNATWVKRHNAPTQEIATGDLDGSGQDELIVDFGGAGLWVRYNNAMWTKLHSASPTHIATGDLDGSGKDDLIAAFGGAGLWVRYNNATWAKIHNAQAQLIATGDFDGNGEDELLVGFGGAGLWARYNDTTWKKLHAALPQRMATADLDSSGPDEAVVDFGSAGLWARYNDKTWLRLHTASPQEIAAGGFD